jgi:hypothetical protein
MFCTLKFLIRFGDPTSERFRPLCNHYRHVCIKGLRNAFITAAFNPSPKIEAGFINEMIDIMDDHELLWVLARISGSSSSSGFSHALIAHIEVWKLSSVIPDFLNRTWSSDSLDTSDKTRLLVICVKVADAVHLPDVALMILGEIFPLDRHMVLRSVEMGQSLRSRGNSAQQEIGLCAQIIVAGVISNVQGSDDRWIALAADQLGKSEGDIRRYLEDGNDNVLLANVTHVTRQNFHSALGDHQSRDMADMSSYILRTLSSFDVRNTLPAMRHEFLALWDQIGEAPNNSVLTKIRNNLLNFYNTLIQGTNDAPTAPPGPDTNTHGDSPDSTSRIDEAVDESVHTDTSPSLPIFRHDASLATVPHSLFPVLAHSISITDPADELPPGTPEATQLITQVAVLPLGAPEPLESHGLSGASQDVGAAGSIADAPSGDHSTLRPIPSTVPPADAHSPKDAAVITSGYEPRGIRLESPPLGPASAASPATLQLASVFGPNATSSAPLPAHQGAEDLNGPIQVEMESLFHTRQSDPSAENLHPSDDPT